MKAADFPSLLAAFFTQRLMQQRQASPHTITSYRDTFRLLVRYAQRELHKPPTSLALDDLGPAFLGAFLTYLETERGNDTRTRNTRLAAIRSFFGYVAAYEPQHAALAQRVLAMPSKRYTRRPVDFLSREEVDALLQAPDLRTRAGRRDRTLLLVAVQTGLRAAELINLRREDVQLGPGAHLRCQGKGRKERCLHCAGTRWRHCGSGWTNSATNRAVPSFRTNAVAHSATTGWPTSWPSIWPLPGPLAPRCRKNGSRPTCCVTPRPWTYCKTASTAP